MECWSGYILEGPKRQVVNIYYGCDVYPGQKTVYWALIENLDADSGIDVEPVLVVSREAFARRFQAAIHAGRITEGMKGLRTVLIEAWNDCSTDGTEQGLPSWVDQNEKDAVTQGHTESASEDGKIQEHVDGAAK